VWILLCHQTFYVTNLNFRVWCWWLVTRLGLDISFHRVFARLFINVIKSWTRPHLTLVRWCSCLYCACRSCCGTLSDKSRPPVSANKTAEQEIVILCNRHMMFHQNMKPGVIYESALGETFQVSAIPFSETWTHILAERTVFSDVSFYFHGNCSSSSSSKRRSNHQVDGNHYRQPIILPTQGWLR